VWAGQQSQMAARVFNVVTRSGLPKRAQVLAASDRAQTWILNYELVTDDDGGMGLPIECFGGLGNSEEQRGKPIW